MANVTVSTNPSTTNNTLIVNFTTDATNIVDIQLTKDGSNYISADTFKSTSAKFDVSSWSNGTYNNCHLKVIYGETSSGGSTGGDSGGSSGGNPGGDSGSGSTETPIELVFRNGKINPSNGAEESHDIIGITDFIQYSTNKKLTCTANNCYLDIFIYDNNYNFEGKQSYNIGNSVDYTLLSTKKYRLEITPSDWVTQITTSNYKNFLVNFNIADTGASTGGSTGGGSTATYTITRNVTNCTSTGGSTIDTSITTTFQSIVTPNDGYTLTTLTVSMGGVDYTNRPNVITDTEWEGKPAKQITIENVNGNIVITASATQQETPSTPSDPNKVYDNPSYSVKDYKIILSQDGYKEAFDASIFISVHYCENSKEVVGQDGETYALALFAEDTGSKFRINGMYPKDGGYRSENKSDGEPYVLLEDAYVPTVNNFNFSTGVRNGDLDNQYQLDTNFLRDGLYTLNCALPAINYTLDNNSNNTVMLDNYDESWYGLSMTLTDRFLTRLNKTTLSNDFGEYGSSPECNKKWKSSLVHELGHSLGFADNAYHFPTLYNYNRHRDRIVYLQAPDIYTLKSLYKEKYGIDISKSQEDINSQVAALGLGTSSHADMPGDKILSIQFDYPIFTDNELYEKADLIIEGKLEFNRCESINIGSENNPLMLEYNIYKIIPNSVIKGEITNYELKIHISEKVEIGANCTYKLYLKQFENAPCSLMNIEQGIQIKE